MQATILSEQLTLSSSYCVAYAVIDEATAVLYSIPKVAAIYLN